MPSVSLTYWHAERVPNLVEIDTQCAATLQLSPPNPRLAEENIRGCIMLLSAHFQGFCRDLYSECAQSITSRVRPTLQTLIQKQFTSKCALDHGNPNLHNLKQDFGRFGFKLNIGAAPGNTIAWLQYLSEMNDWRNLAAHHGVVPAGGLPTMSDVRSWRSACDGLAVILDSIMYNELKRLLRRSPWQP